MTTLKEQYEKEKSLSLQDAAQIESASDYTENYLKHGSACDSSDRSSKRISWVHIAEDEFLKIHRKEILKLAAEMCRKNIGEEI